MRELDTSRFFYVAVGIATRGGVDHRHRRDGSSVSTSRGGSHGSFVFRPLSGRLLGGRCLTVAGRCPAGHRRVRRLVAVALPVASCRGSQSRSSNDFRTTTSVVVPSFHEDPDILMRCLETWRAQDPTEIIVVLDVADTEAFDRITALGDPTVTPVAVRARGQALGARRRHPAGDLGAPGAGRLRHAVAARPADRRADAVRRPGGRRGRHPAERLPARRRACGGGSPTGWSTCATTTTCRRWAAPAPCLRVRSHRGLPAQRRPARCWRTWRTSSSSAGAASPATTAG